MKICYSAILATLVAILSFVTLLAGNPTGSLNTHGISTGNEFKYNTDVQATPENNKEKIKSDRIKFTYVHGSLRYPPKSSNDGNSTERAKFMKPALFHEISVGTLSFPLNENDKTNETRAINDENISSIDNQNNTVSTNMKDIFDKLVTSNDSASGKEFRISGNIDTKQMDKVIKCLENKESKSKWVEEVCTNIVRKVQKLEDTANPNEVYSECEKVLSK